MSRLAPSLVLILILTTSSGCTIMDELDAANAKMPAAETADASAAGTAPGAAAPNPLLQQSKAWWGRATSLAPAEVNASIVNCRIGNSAQYMSKNDCLSRGGVPQGKS